MPARVRNLTLDRDLLARHADFPPGRERPYNFMAFQPPADLARETRGLPHIRLDQAAQFLLGDYLE